MSKIASLPKAPPTRRSRTERIEDQKGQLNLFKRAPRILSFGVSSPFLEGVAFQAQGELQQALDAFRRAAKNGVRTADAMNNAAVAAWSLGRTNEALDCGFAALTHEPGHRAAHYNLGVMLMDLAEWNGAYLQFRAAERAGLAHADLWAGMARVAVGVGREDEETRARLSPRGSTVLVTLIGNVDSTVSIVIDRPGSRAVTTKLDRMLRPMNEATCS